MLELLGATLIVGACGALGLAARQRLTLRIAALTAMLDGVRLISAEIEGRMTPLPDVFHQLARSPNRFQRRLFGEICARMERAESMSLGYHWSSTVRDLADELALAPDDCAVLRDAAAFLGRYDAGQQVKSLDYTASRLEECRRAACAELRQRGNVYRACGVAVGILVVLVML